MRCFAGGSFLRHFMKIIQKISEKSKDLFGKPAATIAFLGDSVTQGCFEIYEIEPGRIETVFDRNSAYHTYLGQILTKLYPSATVNIINAGISGDNAPNGFNRLERDVLRYSPDLVVVCFGLNDSGLGLQGIGQYTSALNKIFVSLKEHNIEIIFMTPNTMCTHVSPNLNFELGRNVAASLASIQNDGILDKYIEEAVKLCERENVKVCDCYSLWKIMEKNGVNTTELLANYVNHPDREMNKLFAFKLAETMFE